MVSLKIEDWIEAVEQVTEMAKIRATVCLRRNATGPTTRIDFYTEGNPEYC